MRPITFALMLAAQPVLADPVAVALPCDAAVAQPCVAAFGLRNFDPLYAQPVVLGDRMRLVGVTRGADGTDRMILLDIALAGGDIVQGMTPLDATAEEMLDTDSPDYMPFRPTAEVSPDGQVVALFTHAPGAEGLPALQFFDGSGKRLGRLDAPYGPDWPVDMERSEERRVGKEC